MGSRTTEAAAARTATAPRAMRSARSLWTRRNPAPCRGRRGSTITSRCAPLGCQPMRATLSLLCLRRAAHQLWYTYDDLKISSARATPACGLEACRLSDPLPQGACTRPHLWPLPACASLFRPHRVDSIGGKCHVSRLGRGIKRSCAQVEHTIECPRDHVTAVLGLGSSVVSGTAGGTISVHSVASAALQQSLRLPRAAPVSALALPGARESASCMLVSAFSRVHAYALDYGTVVGEFEPHADSITAMSASPGGPGGGVLYTASEDTTIRSWSAGAERSPWSTATPPLFEADSPEASVPTAVHVRFSFFLCCDWILPLLCKDASFLLLHAMWAGGCGALAMLAVCALPACGVCCISYSCLRQESEYMYIVGL